MRVAQPPGDKGSLKWLQVSVERRPDLLQPSTLGSRIDWLSPLRCDNWAEYRDASFLACLGLSHLADDLAEFWPRRGPQWDALGRSGDKVILVEAKSHLREFLTPATQATNASRSKIERAFRTVHQLEGIEPPSDWTRCFFQLANRIAHLSFLRQRGIDAHLINVGFVGDAEMRGPDTPEAWSAAEMTALFALGLADTHPLRRAIHSVHPPVALLQD